MNAQPMKECILIMNPAHAYAKEFIDRARRLYNLPVVGLFSLKWRYEEFVCCFTDLKREMHAWFCAFEGTDDQKVRKFQKYLSSHKLKAKMIIPWEDGSVLLAGKLNEALSLKWLSYKQVLPFKDKHVLKTYLAQNTSLRVNRFALATCEEEVLDFQRKINKWPIVLKPVHAGGSWNVYIVNNEQAVRDCTKRIIGVFNDYDQMDNFHLIAEEYIEGEEYCVDGQTDSCGRVMIYDLYKESKCLREGCHPIYLDSYFLDLSTGYWNDIIDYAVKIVKSCLLFNSPFHLELKVDRDGPCLVEVACRPVGGGIMFFTSDILGVDLFELTLNGYWGKILFDKDITVLKRTNHLSGVAIQGVTLNDGCVTKIEGLETLQKHPDLCRIDYMPSVGQNIPKTVNLDTVQYIVLLKGCGFAELQEKAIQVRSQLRIYTENKLNSMVDLTKTDCIR